MKAYCRSGSRENRLITPALRAAEGLGFLGYEVIFYKDSLPETLDKETMVAGFIEDIRYAVYKLTGNKPQPINYPDSLLLFMGRKVWVTDIKSIRTNPSLWPVFIKPYDEVKSFTGVLVKSDFHLRRTAGIPSDTPVWASEPVNFTSEYRVFVQQKEVIGCRHYKGNPLDFPNPNKIKEIIDAYEDQPAAYCLDVGVLSNGNTAVVEINDGYSAGDYGLDSLLYARFLETRWCQLTGMKAIP